jgi:hypothetical protein
LRPRMPKFAGMIAPKTAPLPPDLGFTRDRIVKRDGPQ